MPDLLQPIQMTKDNRSKKDSSTIIIPGSHLSNGITLTLVMMKQMNLNLICQSIIAFGTIGDVLWNRAQILPPGIKNMSTFGPLLMIITPYLFG